MSRDVLSRTGSRILSGWLEGCFGSEVVRGFSGFGIIGSVDGVFGVYLEFFFF